MVAPIILPIVHTIMSIIMQCVPIVVIVVHVQKATRRAWRRTCTIRSQLFAVIWCILHSPFFGWAGLLTACAVILLAPDGRNEIGFSICELPENVHWINQKRM